MTKYQIILEFETDNFEAIQRIGFVRGKSGIPQIDIKFKRRANEGKVLFKRGPTFRRVL